MGIKKTNSGLRVKPGRVNKTSKLRNSVDLHEEVVTVKPPTIDEQRYARHGTRMYVLRRDDYRCRYCGKLVTNDTANMDHVIPWKLGGKSVASNLVTACRRCNKAKGNKHWVPEPLEEDKPKKRLRSWKPEKKKRTRKKVSQSEILSNYDYIDSPNGKETSSYYSCKECSKRIPKERQLVRHWRTYHH